MEIIKEIKIKLYAQYFGQKIMLHDHNIFTGFHCEGAIIKHLENEAIGQPKLILKPLSDITDEDATEVANLLNFKHRNTENGKAFIKELIAKDSSVIHFHPLFIMDVYQYLISKGYDLPNYLLGGKTLQEVGLAIYE